MAIMEHPYYGSFGYQWQLPPPALRHAGELKALIDDAHAAGIAVVMD